MPQSPYSRAVREALVEIRRTSCRPGEVVQGCWPDIDLERGIWTIRETKSGEPQHVMLSRQAAELFESRRGLDEMFVYPSPIAGRHIG